MHKKITSDGIIGDKVKEDLYLERLRHGNVEARLCTMVGYNLIDLLTGKQDPLGLLFKDNLQDEFYAWSVYPRQR